MSWDSSPIFFGNASGSLSPSFVQWNLDSRIPSFIYSPTMSLLLEYIDISFLKQKKWKVTSKTLCGNIWMCYCSAIIIVQYDRNPNSNVIKQIKVFTLLRRGNQTKIPGAGEFRGRWMALYSLIHISFTKYKNIINGSDNLLCICLEYIKSIQSLIVKNYTVQFEKCKSS